MKNTSFIMEDLYYLQKQMLNIFIQLILSKNKRNEGYKSGPLFETVDDFQLSKFKANPEKRGQVLNTGLWRYTRHPNYFGELSQWWGLFLIALEAPWAWCGLIGPLLYSWLVINVTGQRTLDKKMAREKPEYADYMRRTSGLIPLPPR